MFFDSIKQYWYVWLLLLVVIFITYLVWVKAIGASKKRREGTYETIEEMKYWNTLQKKYEKIDKASLSALDNRDLYEAILANIFERLRRAENDVKEYEALSDAQKCIYTTWFILEDCIKGNVRKYFVECSDVLKEFTYESMYAIGEKEMGDILKKAYNCYDVNNEGMSFDSKTIEKLDNEIKTAFEKSHIIDSAAGYIRDNISVFLSDPQSV